MNYTIFPLNNITKRRSETGQIQILAALLFLLLIPTTVIIAQNATNITNYTIPIEGMLVNISDNHTLNETLDENQNLTNTTLPQENITSNASVGLDNTSTLIGNQTINLTLPLNETNTTLEPPEPPEINLTYNQTQPTENTTEPPENETPINITLPEELDTSLNETNETATEPTLPELIPEPFQTKPILEVTISSFDQFNRNELQQIHAIIQNLGNGTALDVQGTWILPTGFEPNGLTFTCGDMPPGSACSDLIDVTPTLQTETGDNEIKVEVKYYE